MGRPPIGKKAMTTAERQRRRRKRLARENAKQAREQKAAERRARSPYVTLPRPTFLGGLGPVEAPTPVPVVTKEERADELARQITEYLTEAPEITIEDVKAAIGRRFG